jgi:fructosamine-3-kinase
MIPPSLSRIVLRALAEAGEASPISRIEPVKGGMVSKSWRIVTRRRSFLLKYHEDPPPYLYTKERHGLELLRAAGMRVPTVVAHADRTEETPGYCIQEWINPGSLDAQRRRLGPKLAEELAGLHLAQADVPGYGSSYSATHGPRDNWHANWVDYFRGHLLMRHVEKLEKAGRMPVERREALDQFMDRLPALLEKGDRRPALLHGDMHQRNIVANRADEPVLIDPATLYGDREYETAYMHLWGFFPPLFWEAYHAACPPADGEPVRREIYLISHILQTIAWGSPQFALRLDSLVHRYVGYGRK